jgi:hypothetical protein
LLTVTGSPADTQHVHTIDAAVGISKIVGSPADTQHVHTIDAPVGYVSVTGSPADTQHVHTIDAAAAGLVVDTGIQFRFDNTPFGGSHNITFSFRQMPDWIPVGDDAKINTHRADSGRAWRYPWYRKFTYDLRFDAVGTDFAATLGSIAEEGVEFLWYKDIDFGDVGTGTYIHSGEFETRPFAPDLVDFSFLIRDKS